MNPELLSIIRQDSAYRKLAAAVSVPASHINISGPCDPQKALLAAALAAETGRVPFIVVPDELSARTMAAALAAFFEKPVRVFRQRELGLADAEASSHDTETLRIGVLADLLDGNAGAVVASAAAALQKLPPVAGFCDAIRVLETGTEQDPDALADHLAAIGYERVRQAEGPGQFARRGDILDVILPGEESAAVRISFFDREIDAVKRSIRRRNGRSRCSHRCAFRLPENCWFPPRTGSGCLLPSCRLDAPIWTGSRGKGPTPICLSM
jgi:transcription-repair coupling factor (superfamily II helicase)